MNEQQDWKQAVATTLDIVRNLSKILFEFQTVLYALRETVVESDPQFQEKYARHYEESAKALGDAKAVTLQLLEKTAAQLRNDPFWKDV